MSQPMNKEIKEALEWIVSCEASAIAELQGYRRKIKDRAVFSDIEVFHGRQRCRYLIWDIRRYRTIRTALEAYKPKTVDMDFIYRWSASIRLRSRDGRQSPKDADAVVKSLVKELGIEVEAKKD